MILVSSYESTMYSQLLSKANGWSKVNLDTATRATNGRALKRNEILVDECCRQESPWE